MKELTADRIEDGVLVCFDAEGTQTNIRCRGPIARPEGRRVVLFESVDETVDVSLEGGVRLDCDETAFIFPSDGEKEAETRRRFDRIFKKTLDNGEAR